MVVAFARYEARSNFDSVSPPPRSIKSNANPSVSRMKYTVCISHQFYANTAKKYSPWRSDHIRYEEDKQVSRGCSAFSQGHRMALATNGFFFSFVGERGNFRKEVSYSVC